MNDTLFSQINTSISVREHQLLNSEQFSKLLQTQDKNQIANLLQTTPYQLSSDDLDDLNKVESVLMRELEKTYHWAYEETPIIGLVQFFTLPYTYHNLKVLLKSKANQKDFSHLLISIGAKSLSELEHLVTTLNSEKFPKSVVEEVQSIWSEFQDYQDVRVLEVGADLAYFKHLKWLVEQLEEPILKKAALVITDLYNIQVVKRAEKQNRPASFMKQLISDEGSLTLNDYLSISKDSGLATWYNQLGLNLLTSELIRYEEKMVNGTISLLELYQLTDILLYQLFLEGKYQVQGPLLLARYLFGKELEVKNLRLILSGVCNELPIQSIKERMRPIYDQ